MAPPPAPPRRRGLAKTFRWVFARFDGRIGRQVYWLSNILLVAVLALFVRPVVDPQTNQVSLELGAVGAVALLLAIVSSLAVGAKRLHDFGASGLFAALLVVPLLSLIVTVVIGVVPGTPGPNRYGEAADRPPH